MDRTERGDARLPDRRDVHARQLLDRGARFLLDLAVKAILATDPRDVSLLHALFYFHAGNGVLNLASTSGGAQDSRFVGGSQLVSLRMAERLGGASCSTRRCGVAPGRRRGDRRERRRALAGRRVIVAVAPMLAGRIEYEPALPALRDGLTQRMPQGSAIKYEAVYAKPFWRSAGLSGYTNSDRPPVRFAYDNRRRAASPACCSGSWSAPTPGRSARSARRSGAGACWRRSCGCSAPLPGGRRS